jgi:diacylglycerol kinase (ATP)
VRKLRVFFSGLRYALINESSVTIEVILSVLVLAGCFYYRQWLDFSLVLVASGLMLVAEMVNTAIEALCDFIEPGHNEKIGVIKDVASAAVGLSILVWSVTLLMEVVRLWQARP